MKYNTNTAIVVERNGMTSNDFQIWQLIQDVIAKDMGKGYGDEEIIDNIIKITHDVVNIDDVRREILRQKRMVVN